MEAAIEDLQQSIIQILEGFDEQEAKGFREPRSRPIALYDTLEEKKQALEGP